MKRVKMIIKNNAEFGVELALAVPYAYWLHKNNQLEYVVTSRVELLERIWRRIGV